MSLLRNTDEIKLLTLIKSNWFSSIAGAIRDHAISLCLTLTGSTFFELASEWVNPSQGRYFSWTFAWAWVLPRSSQWPATIFNFRDVPWPCLFPLVEEIGNFIHKDYFRILSCRQFLQKSCSILVFRRMTDNHLTEFLRFSALSCFGHSLAFFSEVNNCNIFALRRLWCECTQILDSRWQTHPLLISSFYKAFSSDLISGFVIRCGPCPTPLRPFPDKSCMT